MRVNLAKWHSALKTNQLFLVIFLICFKSFQLNAQELKSSFTLDTTKTQVFPYDLDFALKLSGSKNERIKAVYLYRLNNKGKIVFDRYTSLKKWGWNANADQEIKNIISKDSTRAKNSLNITKDSIQNWRIDHKQKEVQVKEIMSEIETDATTDTVLLKSLICEVKILKTKITNYEKDSATIKKANGSRKALIQELKQSPDIFALKEISRKGDTIVVRVPPLKPNKKYLVVTLDQANKISAFRELVKEYNGCKVLEKRKEVIIPPEYLPTELVKTEFVVPVKSLVKDIEGISNFLKQYDSVPKLNGFANLEDFPGPFKYPISKVGRTILHDSLVIPPRDFNKDFRRINGILTGIKNYGDSIAYGSYKIELDTSDIVKTDFKPKKDLPNRLATVSHHLKLVLAAEQSFFVLADTNTDDFENFNTYFDQLIQVLSKNRNLLEKENKELKQKLNKIKVPVGLQSKTLEKSTLSYQFFTRNSRLIKPDFGMLYYFSGNNEFSGVAPYTGFHIDIRSTNEDIPFYQIKGWEKFLTFQLGVPVLAKNLTDGERRKHLVGDAFSLYGGIGFNVSHTIRLSYGAILFRSLDGNSNGERNYKINSAHAISVGINLKLKTLFEGLYGSVQSLKSK